MAARLIDTYRDRADDWLRTAARHDAAGRTAEATIAAKEARDGLSALVRTLRHRGSRQRRRLKERSNA